MAWVINCNVNLTEYKKIDDFICTELLLIVVRIEIYDGNVTLYIDG